MGGRIEVVNARESGGEPVGDLIARPARLKGVEVGGAEIPSMIDELPVLAVLAARAEGETVVRGAEELRAKESDRIRVMVDNLRAIGVDAEELPDGFIVRGSDRPLAGHVRTHHDHRIAMSFGVLGALPGAELEIEAPGIVDVSFPGFWETVRALGRRTA
jgi:3-phosphoshikimate 1-carboxyvinyltransferase